MGERLALILSGGNALGVYETLHGRRAAAGEFVVHAFNGSAA